MGGIAADMRTGQVEIFPQEVDEQRARLDQRLDRLAVHRHGNLDFGHVLSETSSGARATARASARASITPAILVR